MRIEIYSRRIKNGLFEFQGLSSYDIFLFLLEEHKTDHNIYFYNNIRYADSTCKSFVPFGELNYLKASTFKDTKESFFDFVVITDQIDDLRNYNLSFFLQEPSISELDINSVIGFYCWSQDYDWLTILAVTNGSLIKRLERYIIKNGSKLIYQESNDYYS